MQMHDKLDGGKIHKGISPTGRTRGDWGKLGIGQVFFPREEYTNWLSIAKLSVMKIYIQGNGLNIFYSGM